jgi:hypothetical protein
LNPLLPAFLRVKMTIDRGTLPFCEARVPKVQRLSQCRNLWEADAVRFVLLSAKSD